MNTKTLWTLTEKPPHIQGEQPWFGIHDEHGLLIAELAPLTADETDYRRECLRTMAAAPDLLAACKRAAGFVRHAVTERVLIPGFDWREHVVARELLAAIAKAEAMK